VTGAVEITETIEEEKSATVSMGKTMETTISACQTSVRGKDSSPRKGKVYPLTEGLLMGDPIL